MRVLHLYGDSRWTGAAEPTLELCCELRALGVDVSLACNPEEPEVLNSLPRQALKRGVPLCFDFALNRRLNALDNLRDIRRLGAYCEREEIDLLHAHFTHDHVIGGMAARWSQRQTRIVRTNHKAVATPPGFGTRFLYRRLTDGYLTYSQSALAADAAAFSLTGAWRIEPALRLQRFEPSPNAADVRAQFDLGPQHFVVGVIARMQRHRRFSELLEGVRLARQRLPELRVLILGRGTHMHEVAVQPVRRLGLEETVLFAGYLTGAYIDTIAAFDALLFLVPGSDGTCRALREAMAMGKPIIGARRGMIPELVSDGETGLVIDDTPENIAAAIERLARNRVETQAMGAAGRKRAVALYDARQQAARVQAIYEQLLERR